MKATDAAIDGLKRLPISMRLVCETHKTLLAVGRGRHRFPGTVRTT